MQVLEPWTTDDLYADALVNELRKELGDDHVLAGRTITIVARRIDNDDVLARIEGDPVTYAVVHLTWTHSRERYPDVPRTRIFQSWPDWIENCMMPDHLKRLAARSNPTTDDEIA